MTTTLLSFLAAAPTGETPIVPKLPDSPFFWLPVDASTGVKAVDDLFDYIMWVNVISVLLLLGLMIYFVFKFRATSRKQKPEASTSHHTGMEIIWSVVPLPVVLAMFAWGFKGFIELRTTPRDAYEIHVTGQKWKWLFTYPNGYTDDVLHVPMGRKVRVVISSVDVLHSLFLPAFRQKIDAVPGRYTELWFEPTVAGTYPIFCAEYCGTSHSGMITEVVVHEQEDFKNWLIEAEKIIDQMPPLDLGTKMYNQQGCSTCHSTDGSAKTGPSFKGAFGKSETLADGTSVTVDENYIRQSILEPQSQLVKGFPPAMPTFKGKLSDKKIAGLIEFIKAQK
jgi:cytochrome c oxidase subunit 2